MIIPTTKDPVVTSLPTTGKCMSTNKDVIEIAIVAEVVALTIVISTFSWRTILDFTYNTEWSNDHTAYNW